MRIPAEGKVMSRMFNQRYFLTTLNSEQRNIAAPRLLSQQNKIIDNKISVRQVKSGLNQSFLENLDRAIQNRDDSYLCDSLLFSQSCQDVFSVRGPVKWLDKEFFSVSIKNPRL